MEYAPIKGGGASVHVWFWDYTYFILDFTASTKWQLQLNQSAHSVEV